jgi:hypothetical protein
MDSWQAGCEMTSEFVSNPNSTQNGNCSAAPGWNTCAGACQRVPLARVRGGGRGQLLLGVTRRRRASHIITRRLPDFLTRPIMTT